MDGGRIKFTKNYQEQFLKLRGISIFSPTKIFAQFQMRYHQQDPTDLQLSSRKEKKL